MNVGQAVTAELLQELKRNLDHLEVELSSHKRALDKTESGIIALRQRTESQHGNTIGILVDRTAASIVFSSCNTPVLLPLREPLVIREGKCALQWQINDKIAKVVRENELLRCKIFSQDSDIAESDKLIPNYPGQTAENMLEYFSMCSVLFDNRVASFCPIIYSKESEMAKLELLSTARSSVWCLFDKTTKITRWTNFHASTFPSNRCHIESSRTINSMRPTNLHAFQKLFNDFDVYGADLNQVGEIPFSIFMEPRSFASHIDSRMRVSKFMWAVTLVAHNGSDGNHAEIIIEGVNNGFELITRSGVHENGFFIWKSHFLPSVVSRKLEANELVYEERTQVWMVSSKKVQTMLLAIQNEIREQNAIPSSEKEEYFNSIFCRWGKKSIFSGGRHNCFTWAIEKLRTIGIYIGDVTGETIASLVKRVTNFESTHTNIPVTTWI